MTYAVNMNHATDRQPHRSLWIRGLQRGLILATVWWVLTDGHADSWAMGLPAIAVGVFIGLALPAPGQSRWKIRAALGFIPVFLWQSVLGGVDVARRALHPRMPLQPGLITYDLSLEHESARVFLVNTISLLPGTLSVHLEGSRLTLQALDTTLPNVEEIRHMEDRVAGIFGIVPKEDQ